ncbi:MAG: SPFH domain-containing protein [Steroidobacteraceae bacterium]
MRALTPDIAMADVGCRLDYVLADPRRLLAAGPDAAERVRAAGELALRETLGTTGLALLLDATHRGGIGQAVRERAQQLLDAAALGVRVTGVQVNDVQMPATVQPAQRELAKVQGERAAALEAARGYAAAVLPRARAEAERAVLDAQGGARRRWPRPRPTRRASAPWCRPTSRRRRSPASGCTSRRSNRSSRARARS